MKRLFLVFAFLIFAHSAFAQTSGPTAPPPPYCTSSNAGALYTNTSTSPATVYTCSYYNLAWNWVVNPSYGGLVSYPTVPSTCSGALPVFLAGWPNTQEYVCVNGVPEAISGVTAVSVATANGVSGTSSGGTTPALTIALGAITPSSVAINGGTAITAQTGTGGTVVMSASPTFTGTVTAPTLTAPISVTTPVLNGSVNGVANVKASPYNATGNGTTDDSAAFQAAYNTGLPIFVPSGTYKILTGITGTIPIVISGMGASSTILDDGAFISVSGAAASNSFVSGLNLLPVSTFTVVAPSGFPTSAYPVVVDRFGDGIGYQPTIDDTDIWSLLTSAQQDQEIGPTINIGSSTSPTNNSTVEFITGSRININLIGNDNHMTNNNFIGGKGGVYGCIVIGNPNSPSARNIVSLNTVSHCSFSGIDMNNTTFTKVLGNTSTYNGESGIKTSQATSPSTQYLNAFYLIDSNHTNYNRYDGIDATSDTGDLGGDSTYGTVSNNVSTANGQTGITIGGTQDKVIGNMSKGNGTDGILFSEVNGLIDANEVEGNNTTNASSGTHDISTNNDTGSTISNNVVAHTSGINGDAIYVGDYASATVIGNQATGATIYFPGTPLLSIGNSDSTGQLNFQMGGSANMYVPGGTGTFGYAVVSPRIAATTSVTTPSLAINGGTAITAQTGTGGTVVMSGSPTFTGTVTAPTFVIPSAPSGSYVKADGTGYGTVVADVTVTLAANVSYPAQSCSSYTGVAGTPTAVTMTGLTTSMTITHTMATGGMSVAGWSPAGPQLYFAGVLTAGVLDDYVCNNTTSAITTGAATTWNISAR